MTKTTATKTSNRRAVQLLPTTTKSKILSLLGIVLIILLGTYTFRVAYLLPKQERADYLYVEDQIDIAVKSVVKDFSKVQKNKDCSNADTEFGTGPLGCDLQYVIKGENVTSAAGLHELQLKLSGLKEFQVTGVQAGILTMKYKTINCYAYDNKGEVAQGQYSITCSGEVTKSLNWNRN